MISPTRLALAALLGGTALASPALARQDDAVANVLACQSVVDTQARLACFDAAAVRLSAARSGGDIMVVTRADVEAVERDGFGFQMPSLPRLRLPSFSAPNSPHDAMVADAMVADVAAATATPSPAAGAAPAPAAGAAAPDVRNDQAGSAVVVLDRDEDGAVDSVRMNIRRTRTVGYDTTVFEMENGQVWRQTDGGQVRLPRNLDGAFAEIRRGAMSSYLLRINGEGRAIRVRREQ